MLTYLGIKNQTQQGKRKPFDKINVRGLTKEMDKISRRL